MAEKLSQGLPAGEHRINLKDADRSARYFTEVLSAKLKAAGVEVGNAISQSRPADVRLILDYKNSHGVAEVVSAMLLYSNNFIANQLYLMLGAESFGPPATLEKAQQVVAAFVDENFEWQNYMLVDGSGLSRKNRLSAQQLVDILGEFQKHRALLPKQNARIFAKSGTLKGISTYAGYINRQQAWWPFALMINQQIDYRFRERLAQQLLTVPR
jgi:D-alanyl-D-alanine carboxypeptidase/D-alanyl-D-alanine-endopeptidase (penicillin-binding protein 4)